MNKEMMKKVVANKVVGVAIQTSKMPNQFCWSLFGKPKSKYNLTSDDYEGLVTLMKCK